MATTDTENYTRINLILVDGGTKLTRKLFLTRIKELSVGGTEQTVDEFLSKNKTKIQQTETGRNKTLLIFPSHGKTDLDKWDLYLFCFMLQEICDLQYINKKDVEELQMMRNTLCHLSEPTIITSDFLIRMGKLKIIFQRTLSLIGDRDFEKTLNDLVASYEKGSLSLYDIAKMNHKLSQSELQIYEMISKQNTTLANQEKMLTILEDINRKLPTDLEVDVPGIQVIIEVKNCSQDKEKDLLDYLEIQFNETISQPEYAFIEKLPNDDMHKINQAVMKTFQSFLLRGRHLVKVEQKCLLLTIKCKDIPSFICLVRDCSNGSLRNQLEDLRNAVKLWPGCDKLEFDPYISPDDVVNVICDLAPILNKFTVSRQPSIQDNKMKGIIPGGDRLCQSNRSLKLTIHPKSVDGLQEMKTILSSEEHRRGLQEIHHELREDSDFYNAVLSFRIAESDVSQSEMFSSFGQTMTTDESREKTKDIPTHDGSKEKLHCTASAKLEEVNVTGRIVPYTPHTVSRHFYRRAKDTSHLELYQISEALKKEYPSRKLSKDGSLLYQCLAKCMHTLKTKNAFADPEQIRNAVNDLLHRHSVIFRNIIPLLIDDDGNDLGWRSFQEHCSNLTSPNIEKEYAKCCLYLSATCMNTPIYVLSTDGLWMQHWEYFKPLFEYKSQPRRNEEYITMYMSPENEFHMIESTEQHATAPTATGREEMYKNVLEDKEQMLLSELNQSLSERNKCVGRFVNKCHNYGVRLHGRTFKVSEQVFSRGFFMMLAGAMLVGPLGAALGAIAFGIYYLGNTFSKKLQRNQEMAMTLRDIKNAKSEVVATETILFEIIQRLESKLQSTRHRRHLSSIVRMDYWDSINKQSISIRYDVAMFEQNITTMPEDQLSEENVGNLLETMLKVVVAKDTILNTMLRGNSITLSSDYY